MVLVAVALWCAHYANRAVWYPLTRHMSHTTMPVVASAVAFNLVNGTLMGRELARRTCEPFTAANVPGLCVMLLGAVINVSADAALLRLRSARGGGGGKGRKGASRKSTHKVPTGGLFDVVTAPHYLGECVEWSGFAAMTGTAAGWAFAFWTFANLFPRAVAYKRWYREKFGDKYVIRRVMF
jgi:protein-S-isoprenylcysteine O-methyltransferase Ste14